MPENIFIQKFLRIAVISAVALSTVGCAELPAPAQVEKVSYRACLLSQRDATDQTFTEVAKYSLNQAAVTYGVQRTDLSSTVAKLGSSVRKLKRAGCKLIVAAGSGFGAGIADIAKNYASTNFVYLSEKMESKTASKNLENLVVYGVDLFEVGLVSGFLAADHSKLHHVALTCSHAIGQAFLSGVQFGVAKSDRDSGEQTQVSARLGTLATDQTLLPDVYLTAGCFGDFQASDARPKTIGFGRDNYYLSNFAPIKSDILTTVTPQIGARILDVVASDLEADFIGGTLGSVNANFGNKLLQLSPEHESPIDAITQTKLQTVIADYEATLK